MGNKWRDERGKCSVPFSPLPRPKLVYKTGRWRVPSFLSVSFHQVVGRPCGQLSSTSKKSSVSLPTGSKMHKKALNHVTNETCYNLDLDGDELIIHCSRKWGSPSRVDSYHYYH
ncbi:hypothetical protein NC651_013407 [Populus alba x Populus x berolinensis]|nr:hypothetical protein NC651_013407 [Populus alba x Populus x berolinensis]